ncbi:MAG: LysR family transcriptional regulator [Gemmobacter sp.]|nr:LysR family transcriptional regulator [Gemmobacter sp.]
MAVTLKQLEILHAIVMAGSISQATRTVGLSQPTLSQQLARFEEILGTQLVLRGRSTTIKLTAAGEFWFRHAAEILGTINKAEQLHKVLFDVKNLTLRFGTTPSLRGRFTEVAAQSAVELEQIARFDFVWSATSSEVVELINTHKLNCGVVSAASVAGHQSSLYIEHLWRDRIVWTVPIGVPDDVIARTFAADPPGKAGHDALTRYVNITTTIPWAEWSENWFRHNLPYSSPFFGCMTHQVAVDIVASGIATCPSPISLIQNLPEPVRRRIKIFDVGDCARDVVLVMPKHLLSLKPFKTFCDKISAYTRQTYGDDVANGGDPAARAPEPGISADLQNVPRRIG